MFSAAIINLKPNEILDSVYRNDPIEVIMPKRYTAKPEELSENITTAIALHAIANHQTQLFHFFSKYHLSDHNRHVAILLALKNHGPGSKDLSKVISNLLEKNFTAFQDARRVQALATAKGLTELAQRIEADTILKTALDVIEDPERLDKTRTVKELFFSDIFCDGHYEEASKAAIKMNLFSLAIWLCDQIEDQTIYEESKQRIDADVLLERILSVIEDPHCSSPMREIQEIKPLDILQDKHYQEAAEAAIERKLPALASWFRSHINNDAISTKIGGMIRHSLIERHSSTSPSTVLRTSPSSVATSASAAVGSSLTP